jgi:hypothetical protein
MYVCAVQKVLVFILTVLSGVTKLEERCSYGEWRSRQRV